MKKFLLFALICACWGCNPAEVPEVKSNQGSMLDLFVYDSSGSAKWIEFTKKRIAQILASDSLYSAVFAAGIAITSHSRKQNPPILGPIAANFEPLSGNKLHRNGIAARNQAKQIQYFHRCLVLADSLAKYLIERPKSGFTDVNGGLELAELICQNSRFNQTCIRLILNSDLLQTGSDGNQLRIFHFPDNVTIFVVGSAPEIDLKTVFPDNRVFQIPTLQADFLNIK